MTKARQAMEQTKAQVLKANREYEEAETLFQRGWDALARSAEKAQAQATETMRTLAPTLEAFESCAQRALSYELDDPAINGGPPG